MVEKEKVMIISSSKDLAEKIRAALPLVKYQILIVSSFSDAKLLLTKQKFSYCIIVGTMDNFVKQTREVLRNQGLSVLLIVKKESYDQVAYQMSQVPVFVISFPVSKQMVYQSLACLNVMHQNLLVANNQIMKLQKKINDLKIINQAKCILIEQYHYSEEKAHHYIERSAMENAKTSVQVARQIIELNT